MAGKKEAPANFEPEVFKIKASEAPMGPHGFPERRARVTGCFKGEVVGIHNDLKDGLWVRSAVVAVDEIWIEKVIPPAQPVSMFDPETGELLDEGKEKLATGMREEGFDARATKDGVAVDLPARTGEQEPALD